MQHLIFFGHFESWFSKKCTLRVPLRVQVSYLLDLHQEIPWREFPLSGNRCIWCTILLYRVRTGFYRGRQCNFIIWFLQDYQTFIAFVSQRAFPLSPTTMRRNGGTKHAEWRYMVKWHAVGIAWQCKSDLEATRTRTVCGRGVQDTRCLCVRFCWSGQRWARERAIVGAKRQYDDKFANKWNCRCKPFLISGVTH